MTRHNKLSSESPRPSVSAHSLDRLLAFLPLFKSHTSQLSVHNEHDEYSDDFNRFLGILQFSGLLRPTKINPLDEVPVEVLMEHSELLKMADLELLSRLLTAHTHNSRFASGYWTTLIESGHLRAILERLKVIRDEMC